jgi:hypothetical protein
MKYCGGTFSSPKLYLCVPERFVLCHRCTPEGRLLDESRVSTIQKWGPCQSLSEVCTFLGMVGVVWIFIKNFSLCAHPLIKLTRKGEPFIFGQEQIQVQEDLKTALLESPALRHRLHLIHLCHTSHRHFLHSHWLLTMPMQCHHTIPMLLQLILLHYAQ